MVPPSFRRLICYGRITRSLLSPQTFLKQLSLLHSDSLSFLGCHLGSGTQCRHSSALWTKSYVAFTFCFTCIDDLLIASSSPEGHKQHLSQVLERLSAHGININPQKCIFGVESLDFLGHHVDCHGICPLEEKKQTIRNIPQPNTQRKLRDFLGLVNFYHRFLPQDAQILQPLNALLSAPKH